MSCTDFNHPASYSIDTKLQPGTNNYSSAFSTPGHPTQQSVLEPYDQKEPQERATHQCIPTAHATGWYLHVPPPTLYHLCLFF